MSKEAADVLCKARERLIEDRRYLAGALTKPYERGKTEESRTLFIQVQQAIAAIDDAIKEERKKKNA